MSEGLLYFFALTISPPLRFGPALCPAAEEALGQQVSEHQRDGSATIQAQIHHRQALQAPHRSRESLAACEAGCFCLPVLAFPQTRGTVAIHPVSCRAARRLQLHA